MRILLLCEGDAEMHASWSGVSRSLVEHLRSAGHTVLPADVELYGAWRLLVAGLSLAWPRKRWWVRYRLGAMAFRVRSAMCARRVRELGRDIDVVLQVGATFHLPEQIGVPVALYCDSNIELSRSGASTGHSEASFLTPGEIDGIRMREAGVYGGADLIFTMSERVRQSFITDFGLSPERLITVHCAPNVSREVEVLASAEGPPRILFVGRDFGRKGGDLLLQAFADVRRRIPEARLLMVGSRPKLEPPAGVEFMGFQSRDTLEGRQAMEQAYLTSTVFCLPTRFEPFGTSFVEAMLYQLPCVGPNAWAVPEIIRDGETGLLVPPEDPKALADALVRLLSDRELAQRLGEAARYRTLEHFTWPGVVSRMVEAMQPLLLERNAHDHA
jgi:glycosyltransferase involved in cell wall biosynthesis